MCGDKIPTTEDIEGAGGGASRTVHAQAEPGHEMFRARRGGAAGFGEIGGFEVGEKEVDGGAVASRDECRANPRCHSS